MRSDLLEQFRKLPASQPYAVPLYPFGMSTLFDSHRPIVRFFRRLFKPILKLVFNVNALSQSLHQQAEINRQTAERLERLDTPLYYELLHNLVVEFTRVTIEMKNTKMRVESLASRLEFNERRARALESVVVYKADEESGRSAHGDSPERSIPPDRNRPQSDGRFERRPEHRADVRPEVRPSAEPLPLRSAAETSAQPGAPGSAPAFPAEGPGQRSRRRRRRRGRRGGASAVATMGVGSGENSGAQPQASGQNHESSAHDDSPDEATSTESPSPTEDARDTRPEPFENAFGSAAHPAEPQPAPAEDATAESPEPRVAPDTPDADAQ